LNKGSAKVAATEVAKVKIFGERNTGTRAVITMLRMAEGVRPVSPKDPMPDLDELTGRIEATLTGFRKMVYRDAIRDIRDGRLGGISSWKHAAPKIDHSYVSKGASVLFLVRDPYSWIASLYRNPYHARAPEFESLNAFIRFPWVTLARDNVAPILPSPMDLWNTKLRAYREFARVAPVPSAIIQFENFVLTPVLALSTALEALGIEAENLFEIEASTKGLEEDRFARQAHYREEAWKRQVSLQDAELINGLVDWEVAESFGYQQRSPEEFS